MTFRSIFVILALSSAVSAKKRYDGYQLIELKPLNFDEQNLVKKLIEDDIQLDVWSESRESVDVLVSPQRVKSFESEVIKSGIRHRVKIFNIQEDIDAEEKLLEESKTRRSNSKLPIDYNNFNSYDDIMRELDELVVRCPSALTCETIVHGVSAEGHPIKGIRIYRTDRVQKKVWIDATIHAREWLATATNLKIISTIVDSYSTDSSLRPLVDTYDWYLTPIINTDGYVYTWTNDRLWRKNRTPNELSSCRGTDLNRNFNHMWGNAGSSLNPCSETFQGRAAGSELEVQAQQRAFDTLGANLLLSVSLHTYGQMWLTPWGYESSPRVCYVGPDNGDLMRVANLAADAVQSTFNTVWTRGPFCSVLYPGSGTSIDYGKGVAGIKYTFLPELRGNNFIVQPNQIQPAFEETWNGIKAAIAAVEAADRQ